MLTGSRKTVSKVRIKLYWAFEGDDDKNNGFGDNNHDYSLHSLWTCCVLACYFTLYLPRRISPDRITRARIYLGVKPIKYKEREQESAGRAFTPQY